MLDIRLKLLGEEHSSTAECFLLLVDAQYAQDDLKSTIQYAKETNCTHQNQTFWRRINIQEQLTITMCFSVGNANAQSAPQDFASALQSYQHALDIRLKLFEEEHSSTADSYAC